MLVDGLPTFHLTLPPTLDGTPDQMIEDIARDFASEEDLAGTPRSTWAIADTAAIGAGAVVGPVAHPQLVVDLDAPEAESGEQMRAMCRSLTTIAVRHAKVDPSLVMVEYRSGQWF